MFGVKWIRCIGHAAPSGADDVTQCAAAGVYCVAGVNEPLGSDSVVGMNAARGPFS